MLDTIDHLLASQSSLALPASAPTANNSGASDIEQMLGRNRTVRTYLWLLGYLSSDNGNPHLTSPLKRAIRQFQEEAGLVQDNWVGTKTWQALQTLVSFEAGDRIDLWVGKTNRQVVLGRAIKARLHVLGFIKKSRFGHADDVNHALDDFYQHAKLVGLTGSLREHKTKGWGVNKKLISALFDADQLLMRTAQYQQAQQTTLPVCVNLAKIELFLLGYDIHPSGMRSYRISMGDQQRFKFFQNNPTKIKASSAHKFKLYQAMISFNQSMGISKVASLSSARKLDYHFLSRLAQLHNEVPINKAKQAQQTFDKITHNCSHKAQSQIWQTIKKLGGRIYDGVKRVLKWFVVAFKRTVKDNIESIKNLARIAHILASEGLSIVKQASLDITASIRFITQKPFKQSSYEDVYISRTKNVDYVVVINDQASTEALKQKTDLFKTQIQTFKKGMLVLRKVIRGIKLAARLLLKLTAASSNPLASILGLLRVLG